MKAAISLLLVLAVFYSQAVLGGELTERSCRQVTGKVLKFDPNEGSLVIKNRKGELNFKIDDKTCLKTSKNLSVQQPIRAGDTVTVRYVQKDLTDLARSITLNTKIKAKSGRHKKHHRPLAEAHRT